MSFRSSRAFALLLGSIFLAACGGGAATTDDPGTGELDAAPEAAEDVEVETAPETSEDTEETADTFVEDTFVEDTGADTGVDTGVDTGTDTGSGEFDCTLDSDGDGIPDFVEGRFASGGPIDTDKDGKPDYLDDDSDGDGILDKLEWFEKGCASTGGNDADGDGVPNFRDSDSDGNGLLDKDEVCPPAEVLTKLGKPACVSGTPYDFDGDGIPDYLDPDNDHDSSSTSLFTGLDDKYELDPGGKLVDTDKDGIPDLYDVDSDGDGILDLEDGFADADKDGQPNFRDLDSDNDGIADACEGAKDTDGDGKGDYVDLDSDGDFLLDAQEDKNGNCKVDFGETDRLKKDTDGDGHDDFVETLLTPSGGSSWALDATKTPWNQGKFYFIEPYSPDGSAKPTPSSTPLALSTTLNQGDVAFLVDTTTSMTGIENALASSIASKIIPGLAAKIPDLNLGVIGYDDALAKPWGDATGDSFVWFPNGGDPAKGSFLTSNTAHAIAAANGLNKVTPGGTYPEGSVPALWWAITNDSFTFYSASTGLTKSFSVPGAVPSDRFGGMRFRKDALPIVIQASDANMHNGKTTSCLDGSGVLASPCTPIAYTADAAKASSIGKSPTIDDLVARLKSVGAKYLGVSVHGTGGTSTGRSSLINRTTDPNYYQASLDMLYLARATGAKVLPSILGGTTSDCKTSNPTATVKNPADADGLCPLVFDITYDGAGLGDKVVNAVVALLAAIKFDVHVVATPVITAGVDPVDAFMDNALPMAAGGKDPVTGGVCVTFPSSATADRFKGPKALAGTDGAKETILDLNPGPLYCFAVTPKPNVTVPAKSTAQVFTAKLRAVAEKPAPPEGPGGTFTLGADREVLFIVPPLVN